MPVTPTYPGVYVEEIPSGVRTISGVATSTTAFVGRARRGPVNEPVRLDSFADFERAFGGLWESSTLGFSVRDFYLNGGSQAVVVRLFSPFFATEADRTTALTAAQAVVQAAEQAAGEKDATAADVATKTKTVAASQAQGVARTAAKAVADAADAAAKPEGATPAKVVDAAKAAVGTAAPLTRAQLSASGLDLQAAGEGAWGNQLRARIDHDVAPGDAGAFNLTVRDGGTETVETFRNVSVESGAARRVDKVLENESRLVRARGSLPGSRPSAHAAPQAGKSIWEDQGANKAAASASVDPNGLASDGVDLKATDFTGPGLEGAKRGLYALEKAELFNLLCIPPYAAGDVEPSLTGEAAAYCERRRAVLVVDPPLAWTDAAKAAAGVGSVGTTSRNAAVFFPRLMQPNPLRDNQLEAFAPSGAVAGVIARTDATRGVWKAPAGLDATLVGARTLSVPLTDPENGQLNPVAVNALRTKPGAGHVVWGARTLRGDDRVASEWKYLSVRRTALYLEESLYRGTEWVVFEPNDEPLWAQIRLNVGAFMHTLFRQGAFAGTTPRQAYFVACDRTTTTEDDVNRGIVNIVVGFAPLKPAEFVILRLQQIAQQASA